MRLRRYGWLVLVGLILGLSFGAATLPGRHQSQAVSPDVSTPANDAARNPVAANIRNSRGASTPADAATDPLVEQCSQDYGEALRRHLYALANRESAHSQLALALLVPSALIPDGNDDYLVHSAKAYAEARRLDPGNPLLAWLEAKN